MTVRDPLPYNWPIIVLMVGGLMFCGGLFLLFFDVKAGFFTIGFSFLVTIIAMTNMVQGN